MQEYMVMLRGSFKEWNQLSPDEMKGIVEQYSNWASKLAKEERLVGANALSDKSWLINQDQSIINQPFADSKEGLTGYFIIRAENHDEITKIVKDGCPCFQHGESAEIIPIGHDC